MARRILPPLPTVTHERARGLRQSESDAEQRLWFHLRGRRLKGWKFRRQHPVPPYIVDFYCEAARLVVELDGSQHTNETDEARTRYLESMGLKILRYWDHDVLQQTHAVLESILGAAENRTLTPTPLPAGEGLEGKER